MYMCACIVCAVFMRLMTDSLHFRGTFVSLCPVASPVLPGPVPLPFSYLSTNTTKLRLDVVVMLAMAITLFTLGFLNPSPFRSLPHWLTPPLA